MVRSRQKSKVEELDSLLKGYSGKTLDVICRGAPDPDFIGSARAFEEIASCSGVRLRYLSTEPVGQDQNREELAYLHMDIPVFDDPSCLKDSEGYVVLDSSDIDDSDVVRALKGVPWVALIDHHDPNFLNGVRPKFIDVRDDVGSTCTILTPYLLGRGSIDSGKSGTILATVLNFGIQVDTNHFQAAKSSDHRMMAELLDYSDMDVLNRLLFQSTPPSFIDTSFEAWSRKRLVGHYALASVSELSSLSRDAIAYSSQQMVKAKGVDTSIVYAMINNPKKGISVQGSFRTCDNRVRPSEFLDSMFPDKKYLKGSCGGRANMGGFKIPLDSFTRCAEKPLESKEEKWEYAQFQIVSRFYQALGFKFTDLCECKRKTC